MTKAQQQLEQDISVNIGTDLFNALFCFDRTYKTRRGLYNKLSKLNRFAFQNYVVKVKNKVSLSYFIMEWGIRNGIRNGIKDETNACLLLRVHYNALCNYVSSL